MYYILIKFDKQNEPQVIGKTENFKTINSYMFFWVDGLVEPLEGKDVELHQLRQQVKVALKHFFRVVITAQDVFHYMLYGEISSEKG